MSPLRAAAYGGPAMRRPYRGGHSLRPRSRWSARDHCVSNLLSPAMNPFLSMGWGIS